MKGKILASVASFVLAATLIIWVLNAAWPEVAVSGLLLLVSLAVGPLQVRIVRRQDRKRLGRGKK